MNKPFISIITVVFNGEETLQNTIDSIKKQTYNNLEHIIIDGNSKDSTISIIKKNKIKNWISEPDKGIYDAMNKGIAMAMGDYIWFINSGDEIMSDSTISDIFNNNPSDADIYYGETVMIDSNRKIIGDRRLKTPEKLTYKSFKKGMLVSHQSFIVRKKIVDKYNLKYKYSADFDWCLKAIKRSKSIINTHLVLSKFLDGGFTKQNIAPGLKERFKIMVNHYGLFSTLLAHIPITIKFFSYLIVNRRF